MKTKVNFHSTGEIGSALDSRSLYLLILPTENCNFRCSYCYEEHVPGLMKPEIVDGIKKLINSRMDDIQRIQLSWFGGEPLLGKEIVYELSEFVQHRCTSNQIEHIAGGMTTNGYLLSTSVMSRLIKANQKHFHISLDGIAAIHDKTRPLASGKGTFNRIWENLTALRASKLDFEIVLRLHFGMSDVADSEALCRHVDQNFGGDERFRVTLQGITNLGGNNGKKLTPLPLAQRMRIARHLAGLFSNVPVADPDLVEEGLCYAAQPNHLIIRPDGRISKCAVNLADPRNTVGRLDASGRLNIDTQRFQPWLKGFDTFDTELLTCPYKGLANNPVSPQEQIVVLRKKTELSRIAAQT